MTLSIKYGQCQGYSNDMEKKKNHTKIHIFSICNLIKLQPYASLTNVLIREGNESYP